MEPLLTTIILAFNEEANLPACLASLDRLNCATFVVDSGSTDRTVEIAEAAGAVVVRHDFENYAAQRNWAQRSLPIRSPWVLHLDADERLTPDLVNEVNTVLPSVGGGINGFLLRKRTVFMGRWIKHGGHYPSYHLRLFRPEHGACEDRLYDQHFVVRGRVERLQHDYLDVLTSNLSTWTVRHVRWAELEAQELTNGQAGSGQVRGALFGTPIERKRWLRNVPYRRAPLFTRAFLYWFYRYVLKLGVLDGTQGLIFHFLQAFWYRFLVDAKIYEQQHHTRSSALRDRASVTPIPPNGSDGLHSSDGRHWQAPSP
jgi:glycosyltransferase involved in cell wall biosynthesis